MFRIASNAIISSIILISIIIAGAAPLAAQSTSTRLEGVIWDSSGESVPEATVTAIEENTGWQAQTVSDNDGYYIFLALQPGTYTVSVKAKGFKEATHKHLSLLFPGSVTDIFTVDVAAAETVTAAQELPRLNDSALAGAFSRSDLDALPLLSRNPLSLAIYQPGVQINGGNEGSSAVNGARREMNSASIDGITTTDPMSPSLDSSLVMTNPDSLQELRIIRTGGKAEFGRSGGAQFMMLSRRGGKAFSGNVYDYARNHYLNANDFFNNSANFRRPEFNSNIFGATASGRASGKTNFFINFEGNRIDRQVIRNRQVLTPEAKTGLFRWYASGNEEIQSFNIADNDPRKLGIDPAIASILSNLPDPNNTAMGDGLNTGGFQFRNSIHSQGERANARVDHQLSDKHQLFLRLNWDHFDGTDIYSNADAPFPGGVEGALVSKNWGFVAGSNWAPNPQMANELRIGYFRKTTDQNRPARLSSPMYTANSWTNPENLSFPGSYGTPVFEIADNLSQIKGAHTFKYGFVFRRSTQNSTSNNGIYPTVTFGLDNGNAPAASIGPSVTAAIASGGRRTFEYLYNDLLGRIESVNQTFYSNLSSFYPAGTGKSRSFSFLEFAGFIQDDWRILPNLTLNFGLRYEMASAPTEKDGQQIALDQASQVSNSANISGFTALAGGKWQSSNQNNFAPRAGFAWDIFSTGRTVLRGGFGIFYDNPIGAITSFIDTNSYGFSQNVTAYPNASGTDQRLRDGISALAKPQAPALKPPSTRSSSIAILDPNLRTPRVHQFHLTLEKRIFGNAVFEMSYAGAQGRKLFQYLNLNQTKTENNFLEAFQQLQAYRNSGDPVPAANTLVRIFGSPSAAVNAIGGYNIDTGQAGIAANIVDQDYYSKYKAAEVSDFYLRNFPQFDKFLVGSNAARSWYNSAQFSIHARGSAYYWNLNYTYSRSFDTSSSSGADYVSPFNSFKPELNKAPSDFDRMHVLNFTGSFKLPIGRDRTWGAEMSKYSNAILGGWNLGLLSTWESGQRFSIYSGLETMYAGVTSLVNFSESRKIGSIFKYQDAIYWFNTDQTPLFTLPKAGELGSSGRNSFKGPRYFNIDATLYKSFPINERKSIQFRFEAYNVLNNTNFGVPDLNLYSNTFGRLISTQGSPRMVQLGFRFQF